MAEKMMVNTDLDAGIMVVERVFDAPRDRVFRAWSEAEALSQWFGPKDWTVPFCDVDFRPGGVWHYCMQGPGGEQSWGKSTYEEIIPPERIVYTDAFSDEQGNVNADLPVTRVVLEFIDEGGKTRIVSRSQFGSREDLQSVLDMGMVEGVSQTLDRLDEYLARA